MSLIAGTALSKYLLMLLRRYLREITTMGDWIMRKIFFALTCAIFATIACGTVSIPPTSDPNVLQNSNRIHCFGSTRSNTKPPVRRVALQHLLIPMLPTITPQPTETFLAPVSYTYNGTSLSCNIVSHTTLCVSNPSFTVKLSNWSQGNVTGIFEQYTYFLACCITYRNKDQYRWLVENIIRDIKGDFWILREV